MTDPLAPARGIILGLIISVVLWVVIVSAWAVLVPLVWNLAELYLR